MSMTPTTEEAKTKGQVAFEAFCNGPQARQSWHAWAEAGRLPWERVADAVLKHAALAAPRTDSAFGTLAVPDGWMLVPEEATGAMWSAGQGVDTHPGYSYGAVWRAMVEAATAPPVLCSPASPPSVPDSTERAAWDDPQCIAKGLVELSDAIEGYSSGKKTVFVRHEKPEETEITSRLLVAYMNTAALILSATPAPSSPGVPDSLWALSEAAPAGRFEVFRGIHHYVVVAEATGQEGLLNLADANFAAASANFVRTLRSAHPAGQSDDGAERCIACDKPLKAGERVIPDAEGGKIHTACCGPEREGYTKGDGEPLGPNDPIPQGYIYEPERPAGQSTGQGAEPRRMAEGCCSAVSPCSHQQRDPYSLCAVCQKANGLADKIQAAAPDSTRTGQVQPSEKLVRFLAAVSARLRDNPPNGLVEDDLYVAAKNEGPDSGWRYIPTGLTVGDLDEARDLLAGSPGSARGEPHAGHVVPPDVRRRAPAAHRHGGRSSLARRSGKGAQQAAARRGSRLAAA